MRFFLSERWKIPSPWVTARAVRSSAGIKMLLGCKMKTLSRDSYRWKFRLRTCKDFEDEIFPASPRAIIVPEVTQGEHAEERAGSVSAEVTGVCQPPCPIYPAAGSVILEPPGHLLHSLLFPSTGRAEHLRVAWKHRERIKQRKKPLDLVFILQHVDLYFELGIRWS